MPPEKARFGHRVKGGGKRGSYGSGRDCWRDDYLDRDSRLNWREEYDYYGDWGDRGGAYRTSWDRGGRDSWSYGPSASNPRDRDRFITQMMEDKRYTNTASSIILTSSVVARQHLPLPVRVIKQTRMMKTKSLMQLS